MLQYLLFGPDWHITDDRMTRNTWQRNLFSLLRDVLSTHHLDSRLFHQFFTSTCEVSCWTICLVKKQQSSEVCWADYSSFVRNCLLNSRLILSEQLCCLLWKTLPPAFFLSDSLFDTFPRKTHWGWTSPRTVTCFSPGRRIWALHCCFAI